MGFYLYLVETLARHLLHPILAFNMWSC